MPSPALSFVVPAEGRGERLDHFLVAHLPELSRARLQQLIREGHARVDDEVVGRPGWRLRGGERIALEVVERPPLAAEPEPLPLEILYEDDELVAVNKPAGLVVHAGAGHRRGTLVNALLHRYGQLSPAGGTVRPGIVHRLDKDTSGVLLVARTDRAHRRLAEQFARREVEKRYLALVHGKMPKMRDTISAPVARDLRRRTRMTTRRREGRAATTEYRVLQSTGGFSLLELYLRTGRTHQVRVHLASVGRPVVGDTTYGAPREARVGGTVLPPLGRNFLHAERVRFRHPSTEEEMEVRAELPVELRDFLRRVGLEAPK